MSTVLFVGCGPSFVVISLISLMTIDIVVEGEKKKKNAEQDSWLDHLAGRQSWSSSSRAQRREKKWVPSGTAA